MHSNKPVRITRQKYSNIIFKILILSMFIYDMLCNTISMNMTTSNNVVSANSNITLSLDRSRAVNGTFITPTTISTVNYAMSIILDSSYTITSSTIVTGVTNFSFTPSTNTINIIYNSTIYNPILLTFTVINIKNPYISSNPLATYLQIFDSNNILKDDASNSLTYTSSFLSSSQINWQFSPSNVSTISNLTFNIRTTLYSSIVGMFIQISFRRWWFRSLINTTSTTIFTTGSSCAPLCVINRQTNSTLIVFSNISISSVYNTSTNQIRLTLNNIQSPPTLQLIDQLQLVIRQPQYGSVVQQSNLLIGSSTPNYLQSIIPTTSNTISQIVTLSIDINSQNTFGPNDTLTIILTSGSQLASTDPNNIILISPLITSYQVNIQNLYTIVFSSFTFVSINYANLYANVQIDRIVSAASTKPRNNNKIQLARNGYLYNIGFFNYAVNQAVMDNFTIGLDNNYANSITNGLWVLSFSKGVRNGDFIYVNVPQSISINMCQPQCLGCSCTLVLPTPATPFTQLSISLASLATPLYSLTIATNHRNPIQIPSIIKACSTDSLNYTKQCGSVTYPSITQATLSSDLLTITLSSPYVYSASNYTIQYNFTNYDLQNGYLITILPPILQIIGANSNASNVICQINGQPLCRISINSNGIYINTTIIASIKIYTIAINNIRNPASTQPFTLSAKVAYITGQIYYSIISNYTSATLPYNLILSTHFNTSSSSCTNSAINTLTIQFINSNLPFNLTTVFPNTTYFQYKIVNRNNNVSINLLYGVSSQNLVYVHKNWFSYQSVQYMFTLFTADLLYQIWQFAVNLQNCQPATLSILGYQFTGLPEDSGTLSIAYLNQYTTQISTSTLPYQIKLIFPSQYPPTISPKTNPSFFTFTTISTRTFILQPLQSQQPIIIQLTNFTNAFNMNTNYTNSPISIQLYVGNYLIAQDTTTISYKLTDVSTCGFPCKICSGGNGINSGSCLGCFSNALTTSYLLWNNTSLNNTGRCVSICPSSTYLNTTHSACTNCPISCTICTSNTYCTSCSNNYYLYQNNCITNCPNNFYPSTLNQACLSCVQPCQTCTNTTYCTSCIAGYYLFIGTCVTICPVGYIAQYVSNFNISYIWVCYACNNPCSQCTQSLTNCTKCVNGFYLTNNNNCVLQCSGLLIGYQGVCISCGSTCYACISVPTTCISCSGPYLLYNSTCITSCPTSYYSINNTCLPCPSQCYQCSSSTSCTICSSSFIFHQSYCYSTCPPYMYIVNTTITNTTTNVVRTTRQCQPCSLSSCVSCPNGANLCIACIGGWYLYGNICVLQCPNGTFVSGLSCSNCSIGCITCINAISCLTCGAGYGLYQSACVSPCPTGMVNINNTCKTCSSYIQNCQLCSPFGCNTCIPSYSLFINSTNSYCMLQCPNAYISQQINSMTQCIQCTIGCSTCNIVNTNCTSCITGYYFFNNTCVLSCPNPMISINGKCQACISPCQTCSRNNTMYCQTCIDGTYLFVNNGTRQCMNSCPTKYYAENAFRICIACGTGCISCTALGCLVCDTGYFVSYRTNTTSNITLNNCHVSCPSFLPFIHSPNICSKCSSHCLQCTAAPASTCMQCQTAYYSYNQFCLLTCPSPYQPSNTSKSCVMPSNETNTTNNTNQSSTNTTNTTTNSTSSQASIPFTITAGVIIILTITSRIQYKWSSVPMTILGFGSIIAPLCNIVYLALIWIKASVINIGGTSQYSWSAQDSYLYVKISLYLLLSCLGLIYLSNLFHFIFSFPTLRKDPLFIKYTENNPWANRIITIFSILFEHLLFSLYFCRLFNFSIFKAWLKSSNCLKCLNYIWGLALVGNIFAIISGVLILIKEKTLIFAGIDLIITNSIVIITGLMLFKKNKGDGWVQEDYIKQSGYEISDDEFSTKKIVVLNHQGDSDAQIGTILGDSLEEINGKISKRLFIEDNKVGEGLQQNKQENHDKLQKQQGEQFYFYEAAGDNQVPIQSKNINQPQVVTEGNKKSNENSDQNDIGSQSTDPMKIQPSINILVTAQQMKPGHISEDNQSALMKQKGEQNYQNKSMGWSSLQKSKTNNLLLKNESKITKNKNIFQSQPEDHSQIQPGQQIQQQQQFIDGNQTYSQSNKVINVNSSSKSLKATPNKTQNDKSNVDKNQLTHNLAAIGLNKSRKTGGRSSQQIITFNSPNNNDFNDQTSLNKIFNNSKVRNSQYFQNQSATNKSANQLYRNASRSSNRILNSQMMRVIQEQNEQNQIKINKNQDQLGQEPYEQYKSQTVIVPEQEIFLSNTLNEDRKIQSVSQFQNQISNQSKISKQQSFKKQKIQRSSRLFKMQQQSQSYYEENNYYNQSKSRKSTHERPAKNQSIKSLLKQKSQKSIIKSPLKIIQKQPPQQQNNSQIETQNLQMEIQYLQTTPKNQQKQHYTFANSPADRQQQQQHKKQTNISNLQQIQHNQDLPNQSNQQKIKQSPQKQINQKLQGAHTIFIQSDEQKDVDQQLQQKQKKNEKINKFYTIQQKISKLPVSTDAILTTSKLRTLQLRQQLQKQKTGNRSDASKSLNKKYIKSFRSRNISADRLKLNTADSKRITIDNNNNITYNFDNEDDEIRKNPKILIKQIQRKQRIRNHQQSLKKIYLRK